MTIPTLRLALLLASISLYVVNRRNLGGRRLLPARDHAEPSDALEIAWLHDLRVLDPRSHLRHICIEAEAKEPRERLARQDVLEDVKHDLVCAIPNAMDVLQYHIVSVTSIESGRWYPCARRTD